jgi:nucleotide-binding universal stress UspA family protein
MAWKSVKGHDYLVRYWNDEDVGDKRMTSLGPRSPETEAAKAEFERNRAAVDGALAQLKERLDALARVGKALRVGRLETPAADVLRQFWRAGMLGADLMVAGSAAIHLYEASAGVRVPQAIVPEGDLDLLMVGGGRLDFDDIERVARRADKKGVTCPRHGSCAACGDHLVIKGNAKKRERAERLLQDYGPIVAEAENEKHGGTYGAGPWVDHNRKIVDGLRQVIAIHDDTSIPDGTPVQAIPDAPPRQT